MAFTDQNVVTRGFVRAGYKCEACGVEWSDLPKKNGDSPIDLHSSTTMHVVRRKSGVFVATNPPEALKQMKGRAIRVHSYMFYKMGREDDGFCLCNKCHKKVHHKARLITDAKLPGRVFRNDIPFWLDFLTASLVINGHLNF